MLAAEEPPVYDVSQESIEFLIPKNFKANQPHGLFIWINAGDTASIPKAWEPILAKHNLIVIGAKNSGNKRNVFDRIRMAIAANHNMRERYKIGPVPIPASASNQTSRIRKQIPGSNQFRGRALRSAHVAHEVAEHEIN